MSGWGVGGGVGVLNCAVNNILQEFYSTLCFQNLLHHPKQMTSKEVGVFKVPSSMPQSHELWQVFIERKLMVMLTQSVGNRLKQAVVGLPLRFQIPCAFNYLTKVNSNSYYSIPITKIMNRTLCAQILKGLSGQIKTD